MRAFSAIYHLNDDCTARAAKVRLGAAPWTCCTWTPAVAQFPVAAAVHVCTLDMPPRAYVPPAPLTLLSMNTRVWSSALRPFSCATPTRVAPLASLVTVRAGLVLDPLADVVSAVMSGVV